MGAVCDRSGVVSLVAFGETAIVPDVGLIRVQLQGPIAIGDRAVIVTLTDPSPAAVAEGVDALVVGTGWPEFRALDFERIKRLLKMPIIVDTKNLLDATRELEKDDVIRQALGRGKDEDYADYYIRVKRDEWGSYHEQVTPWEIKEYLTRF